MLVQEKQRVFSCKLNFHMDFMIQEKLGSSMNRVLSIPTAVGQLGSHSSFLQQVSVAAQDITSKCNSVNGILALFWCGSMRCYNPEHPAELLFYMLIRQSLQTGVCLYIYIYTHIILYIYIRRDSLRLYSIAYHVYSGSLIEALGIDLVRLTSSEIKDSI